MAAMETQNTPVPPPPPEYYSLNVRVSGDLITRLRETARREMNGISAVTRRLIARGLRAEDEAASKAQRRG